MNSPTSVVSDTVARARGAPRNNVQGLPLNARVVLLTNCIPPYTLPVLRRLAAHVANLRVLISTSMEPDRHWKPNWEGINVTVQKTVTITRRHVWREGPAVTLFTHFPYDSLALIRRYRPNVVISTEMGFRTMQAALYRLLAPRSRLIIWADVSEHTEREIGRLRTAFRRFLLGAADMVLVNGASGAKYLRRLGVAPDRMTSAPYTTDMMPFQSIPPPKTPTLARRLLYAGRLVESKGLAIFLRTLVRWSHDHPDRDVEMWFVGDGPLRRELERFPLTPRISLTFFGNVPYQEMAKYYAAAGISALPTLSDTWGLVVNEAMAAGLPVLGSLYSQAVQELITDGVNGWTFHPDREDELYSALDRALSAPLNTLARMREVSRRQIKHLTPDLTANRILRALTIAMKPSNSRQKANPQARQVNGKLPA